MRKKKTQLLQKAIFGDLGSPNAFAPQVEGINLA